VKRESTVKSELDIKEEQVSRKFEPIDLTADGDFVLPSRKIGGTIELSDDEEEEEEDDDDEGIRHQES